MTAQILLFPISGDAIARMEHRKLPLANYLQSRDWQLHRIQQELDSAYRSAVRIEERSMSLGELFDEMGKSVNRFMDYDPFGPKGAA